MYIEGQISRIELSLDFPYEIEKRYEKMLTEDSEYAELIYDRLLQDGIERGLTSLTKKFRELVTRRYADVLDIANKGFC